MSIIFWNVPMCGPSEERSAAIVTVKAKSKQATNRKYATSRYDCRQLVFLSYYRTPIILPVVLYGCETLSLTLREEYRLRVFENTVLRRIFGPKRDDVTGDWRKLHNEELHNLYSSPNIIRMIKSRKMRWAKHVALMGRKGMPIKYWWKARRKETNRKTKM
jgi:hypothetical protein